VQDESLNNLTLATFLVENMGQKCKAMWQLAMSELAQALLEMVE
jgi:hypothetical protein